MLSMKKRYELKRKVYSSLLRSINVLLVLVVAVSQLTGCGAVKLYNGPDRKPSEIVYLSFIASGSASLHSIRLGPHSLSPFRAKAAILPGSYEVEVIATTRQEECHNLDEAFCYNSNQHVLCKSSINLDQPGHYTLEVKGQRSKTWLAKQVGTDSEVLMPCSVKRDNS